MVVFCGQNLDGRTVMVEAWADDLGKVITTANVDLPVPAHGLPEAGAVTGVHPLPAQPESFAAIGAGLYHVIQTHCCLKLWDQNTSI